MNDIAAGFWPCKVLDGFYGEDHKHAIAVRINLEIAEGPNKGQRYTYEEQVDNKQAPYIARTCKAVGWQGKSLSTIAADVAAWIEKTGGLSTVEIKHIEIRRGKQFDRWVDGGQRRPSPVWVKAGSIGRGPAPLKQASASALADADEALRRAMDDSGGGGQDDVPAPVDEDIPFITCSLAADRDQIRRVRSW